MTNRQRRLIVLSAAIVLLLGPIVIMGNCSGFNEGSMKVATCAVDFPLARGLADMLWGIVLLSAFILGLPVLAYVATCVVLLAQLNRGLRKASEASAQQSAGPYKAGAPMLTLVASAPMLAVVAAAVLQISVAVTGSNAASSEFDERCKTAGEQLHAAPVGHVQSLYYEGNAQLHTYSVSDGQLGSVASDLGSELNGLIDHGWIRATETDTPTGKKIRHELYIPFAGRAVDQFASQYGVFTKNLAGGTGDKSGIEGTEITVKDLKSGTEIAAWRYFVLRAKSRICGIGSHTKTDVEAFLVRALKLTRQPPQAPPGDAKPVKVISGSTLDLGGMKATPLGDADDSRIYIDKTTMRLNAERSATDAEVLKVRNTAGVASMRASRIYDCRQKKYRVVLFWAWLRPSFDGDNVRPLKPTEEWIAPAAGTVGDLLLDTVCGA